MSKKRSAMSVILAVALATVAIALRGKGRLPDTPEDAVRALLLAAQDGETSVYLSLLSGSLKESFEATRSQLGAAAFRDSLRNSVAGMKGFAVSRSGESSEDRAALDVELVFSDRSEHQRFVLVRQHGGWATAAIDRAAVDKPAMPYNAPVFDLTASGDATPGAIKKDDSNGKP